MKKAIILMMLVAFSSSAFAIKFPMCSIICEKGQACGNQCISKKQVCTLPRDWGAACDYRYISVEKANKAKCCRGKQGVGGCAGDRLICADGTTSSLCSCLFVVHQDDERSY